MSRRRPARPALAVAAVLLGALAAASCGGGDGAAVARLDAPPEPGNPAELDEAVARLFEAEAADVRADPGSAAAWADLAKAYQANERQDLARVCWEQALARDSGRAVWWYHRAMAEQATGAIDAALASIARAQELEPGYGPAWWRRGDWELGAGRLDEAERSYRRAAEVDPGDARAPIGLARVHLARGDAEAAVGLLRDTVAAHPDDSYARFLLRGARRAAGETGVPAPGAAEQTQRIVRNDPWAAELVPLQVSFGARVRLATQYLNDGQLDGAARMFSDLRIERPDDVRVLTKLGQVYLRQDRKAEALGVLLDALQRHPDHPRVHEELTAAFMLAGDAPRALEHADRAVALAPTVGLAHMRRGAVLRALERTEEAEAAFAEAVRHEPGDVEAWKTLGDLRAKLRSWSEASAAYGRAVQLDDADPELYALVAFAALQEGDLARAEAAAVRSLELGPRRPRAVEALLAEVRRRRGAAGSG